MQILRKIGKILSYLPILWADEDWDHSYVLILLRFKLSRMEKFIREKGIHLNHLQDAKKIRRVVLILERMEGMVYYKGPEDRLFPHKWWEQAHKQEEYEYAFVMDQLKKHLRSWWD